jgi:hypothetical protein
MDRTRSGCVFSVEEYLNPTEGSRVMGLSGPGAFPAESSRQDRRVDCSCPKLPTFSSPASGAEP